MVFVKGKSKKEITLTISDFHNERKLFSFSIHDENIFQTIMNIFSINLSDSQLHFILL